MFRPPISNLSNTSLYPNNRCARNNRYKQKPKKNKQLYTITNHNVAAIKDRE